MPGDSTKTIWVYVLLVFTGAVGAAGDALTNHWVRTNRVVWLAASFVLWIIAAALFAWLLKSEQFTFGVAVVLALLIHSTLAVVFDRFYFGGRLSAWQWAGFACALIAIVLINRGGVARDFFHGSMK